MNEPWLSLDDFKKWMRNKGDVEPLQKPKRYKDLIGIRVESKVTSKKLIENINSDNEDDLYNLAVDFKNDGGIILDVDGKNFLIEVDSGQFHIPRHFVKKINP